MSGGRRAPRAGGSVVELHHPDKELFGKGGVTKRELADHYLHAAPMMLRHLRGRPIAVQRWPHGIEDGGGFFVKNRQPGTPDWVHSARVPRESGDGDADVLVCDDSATLAWLADQDAFPLHMWLSRIDRPRRPDRIVFDLDPPEGAAPDDPAAFDAVRAAARDIRAELDDLGLIGYPMTTGSRGVHVVCPIRREIDTDDAKDFARAVAERVAARRSGELTVEQRKDRRRGRLFVDYLRNGYAQLAVAPYAVRAAPDAPVATPITWEELGAIPGSRAWTVRTFGRRASADPWKDFARRSRSPRAAMRRLREPAGQG
ncbi:non-homologous end-joining DNA ligase [Nocardiopsis composta]|uniref:Bifunctional non-homologous end joining protein LigD n=1 Tax=Nocardiopsis composta TaxID=157465 RepID=A0A7W8VCC2_9ACTN|nr:non-homologous end-joining DNA ligase [Nocardiopsis composta]MBB5430810.1 bifunctional non-homologous end joining protein LigD [Nocardiopsis composta]